MYPVPCVNPTPLFLVQYSHDTKAPLLPLIPLNPLAQLKNTAPNAPSAGTPCTKKIFLLAVAPP